MRSCKDGSGQRQMAALKTYLQLSLACSFRVFPFRHLAIQRLWRLLAGLAEHSLQQNLFQNRLRRQNHIPKNLTKRLCRSAKHAISGDLTPDSVQLLAVPSQHFVAILNMLKEPSRASQGQ